MCPGCGAARSEVKRCIADPGPPRTLTVPGLQRPTSLRSCCAAPGTRSFSTFAQSKHAFRVAVADLLGQIEGLHHRNGGADVAPALLLVERTIGGEQHVSRPEKRQPANGRRACAGERGIAVEALEIVERPLFQLFEDE